MGDCVLKKEPLEEGSCQPFVKLTKDQKTISRVACVRPPNQMPPVWEITSTVRKEKIDSLPVLPGFSLKSACENVHQEREWGVFLDFLQKNKRVAISKLELCEVYILSPDEDSKSGIATVLYKEKISTMSPCKKCHALGEVVASGISSPPGVQAGEAALSNSDLIEDRISPERRYSEVNGDHSCGLKAKGSDKVGISAGTSRSFERNFVVAHPSYLKTLAQTHSGWIFGAIAELVDNSRDAKATKWEELRVSVI